MTAPQDREKRVPREPTEAMLDALCDKMWNEHTAQGVWRAMYDAAPRQPSESDYVWNDEQKRHEPAPRQPEGGYGWLGGPAPSPAPEPTPYLCKSADEYWRAMAEWHKSMPIAAHDVFLDGDTSDPLI